MSKRVLPYGCQWIEEDDIAAVVEVLRSGWLTTGPKVEEFEAVFSEFVGANYAVAVSSGTAALHAAMYAIGIEPDDEVIVPPITFAATANAVVFQGGVPVFVDVREDTLLLDPEKVESALSPRTKAIIAVDYTGHPCDYDALRAVADRYGLVLVADACHSLGGAYKGRKVGSLADLNIFSFHPVKPITTGEGGMVTTDRADFAQRMRSFRNHCISSDHHQRDREGSWFYEIADLGFNYRLTDIQCALGISQLKKLCIWTERRQEIACRYNEAISHMDYVKPLHVSQVVSHAYHLYVVRIVGLDRAEVFFALREHGIGVNVHYIPVYYHPLYRERFGMKRGLCPVAEDAYEELLTLPLFPKMDNGDIERVICVLSEIKSA